MNEYAAFLERKRFLDPATGLEKIPKLNGKLFDFQKDIVTWALKRGRAAIFADCGMGKTFMQLEWARHIDGNVLILAPLAVSAQTVREGEHFGIKVKRCANQADVEPGINITNYEKLEHFDATKFKGVVLDECFPPDTIIDTPSESCYIKDIRPGRIILNAAGEDHVKQIYKRRIKRAVYVSTDAGRITTSENHPFFTLHGWRSAQYLQPGDYIMETKAAMCLVRYPVSRSIVGAEISEILREILLSEMANEYAGTLRKSSQSEGCGEAREIPGSVVSIGQSKSRRRVGENSQFKPNEGRESQAEGVIDIAGDEAQTFRAWGQWSSDELAAARTEGCSARELGHGISYIFGPAKSRISDVLQSRLRISRIENSHRSGWGISLLPKSLGWEEGRHAGFSRVEGIEILEQGHPGLERYRKADGHVYFYDIKAERHPSFSVNGLLVHNSSILKSYDGKTRTAIIEAFEKTPLRLAATATPSPNDYMELGNHSEFLGVMTRSEMLSMFFVHDGGETQKWRLKGHAQDAFWRWVCSWAVMIRKPSDLGYDDASFVLPELRMNEHVVTASRPTDGMLFAMPASSLQERISARRETMDERAKQCATLVNADKKTWIVWCNLNGESERLAKMIPDAVEIRGSQTNDQKENTIEKFLDGRIRVIVTKSSMTGFGLNLQLCHNMAFVGLNDSYEEFYQAVRRCWRFGQKKAVNVHVIAADTEGAVLSNIKRKEKDAAAMAARMVQHMKAISINEVRSGTKRDKVAYKTDFAKGSGWEMRLGDCVEGIADLKDNSIHYSIYSPPFASLYTYSNSDRDMGNCRDTGEFYQHYSFLVKELYRATMPGRLTSFHCMNLPTSKIRDGIIGIRDFRGELIRIHEAAGWVLHSEVCIWKDPVTAMQRTKAIGLLYKQLKKDSHLSRQGIPDYLVTMRKPGDNPEPIKHDPVDFPVDLWQRYASPVWMDINPNETLQYRSARENEDERHICPLQLEVIRRALKLWSNPSDLILSPFAGIGSEGHEAILAGRRFLGIELKESYWKCAVNNMKAAEASMTNGVLL